MLKQKSWAKSYCNIIGDIPEEFTEQLSKVCNTQLIYIINLVLFYCFNFTKKKLLKKLNF